MNNYSKQIDHVTSYYASNPKEKAKLAKRVKHRVANFPIESRQNAMKATLKLINEHDWNLAENEFLNGGLINKIVDYIIWSKSIQTK